MKPLRIHSWYLARLLGVTSEPQGPELIPVRVSDIPGMWLWWPVDAKLRKAKA